MCLNHGKLIGGDAWRMGQIALLVIPMCIIAGWFMGQPLDLNLHVFESTTFVMCVITVAFMVQAIVPV